jgi:hypothetical protein
MHVAVYAPAHSGKVARKMPVVCAAMSAPTGRSSGRYSSAPAENAMNARHACTCRQQYAWGRTTNLARCIRRSRSETYLAHKPKLF